MPLLDTDPTPEAWLRDRLPHRFYGDPPEDGTTSWYSVDDLLANDGELLRRWHARLVDEEHTAPAAAATYLAGWLGGMVAEVIGHAIATADAGFLLDRSVRWHQHADGWIDRIDPGRPPVLVPHGHPWLGQPGVTAVPPAERNRATIAAMVRLLDPLIDACHRLARTGKIGLWNEVADGLGLSVAHQAQIPTRPDVIDALANAVATPGAPWRAAPQLHIVDTGVGPAYIGQKGGCCLAYTCPEVDDTAGEALDEDHLAYLERFPEQPGEPRYCSSCKFRDPDDCVQRQRFWVERQHSG